MRSFIFLFGGVQYRVSESPHCAPNNLSFKLVGSLRGKLAELIPDNLFYGSPTKERGRAGPPLVGLGFSPMSLHNPHVVGQAQIGPVIPHLGT